MELRKRGGQIEVRLINERAWAGAKEKQAGPPSEGIPCYPHIRQEEGGKKGKLGKLARMGSCRSPAELQGAETIAAAITVPRYSRNSTLTRVR